MALAVLNVRESGTSITAVLEESLGSPKVIPLGAIRVRLLAPDLMVAWITVSWLPVTRIKIESIESPGLKVTSMFDGASP